MAHSIHTRQTLLVNNDMQARAAEFGSTTTVGADAKSALFVPLLVGDTARGLITLQNLDRENVFSDADVRLLETLACSMSVALENARLFDETQQRAAELDTVNTVSQQVAGKLDLNALIELVGEQSRQVFKADLAYVALLDRATGTINFPYPVRRGKPAAEVRRGADEQDHPDRRAADPRNTSTTPTAIRAGTRQIAGTDLAADEALSYLVRADSWSTARR